MTLLGATKLSMRANAHMRRTCWVDGVRWAAGDTYTETSPAFRVPFVATISPADVLACDWEVVEPNDCGHDFRYPAPLGTPERWCAGCGWYPDRMPSK